MIIGISGKKGSGKDTIGKIIQILTAYPELDNILIKETIESSPENNWSYEDKTNWKIKKFADKVKDIVCLLIGCTREQLEDGKFKEKELGEEWKCFEIYDSETHTTVKITSTKNEAIDFIEDNYEFHFYQIRERTLTPRLLLQLIGTECGRDILHPNIWVNALMSEYEGIFNPEKYYLAESIKDGLKPDYPNWIITDTRFPNELEAVKDRGGITIRVNRNKYPSGMYQIMPGMWTGSKGMEQFDELMKKEAGIEEHESEIALDSYNKWDHIIDNSLDLDYLINKVRDILKKERLL